MYNCTATEHINVHLPGFLLEVNLLPEFNPQMTDKFLEPFFYILKYISLQTAFIKILFFAIYLFIYLFWLL